MTPEIKAHILIEALPYIRRYQGETLVVKLGGEVLENERLAGLLAQDLTLLTLVGFRLVVVHGGGPQVTRAMNAAGIAPTFVAGLRVTDAASMDVVRQVLVGSINSELTARLNTAGLDAVGLSGVDAGLIDAEPTSGPQGEDLGNVGSIGSIRPDILNRLLDGGFTPVVASVAAGPDGFLNINADSVAGAIAAALGAVKLVYLTNVEGLYADLGDKSSLISELKADELDAMLPGLSEGMRPKTIAAVHALRGGVGKVHILDGRIERAVLLEIFTDGGIGTQVVP
ncbi:MAG: acetylglutamate kinase [Actinomycetota bacterium]